MEGKLIQPRRLRVTQSGLAGSGVTYDDRAAGTDSGPYSGLRRIYFFLFNDLLLLVDATTPDLDAAEQNRDLQRAYVLPLRRTFVYDVPEGFGMEFSLQSRTTRSELLLMHRSMRHKVSILQCSSYTYRILESGSRSLCVRRTSSRSASC